MKDLPTRTIATVHANATLRYRGAPPDGRVRCALGRSGVVAAHAKREGDGATPAGVWPLRRIWVRADRLALPLLSGPSLSLPVHAIDPLLGWCDDPSSEDYNRPVRLPHPASHERMWREDSVYDLVVELGFNDDPPILGRGSAIFLHLARPDFSPTEGCVAVELAVLLEILAEGRLGDVVEVATA